MPRLTQRLRTCLLTAAASAAAVFVPLPAAAQAPGAGGAPVVAASAARPATSEAHKWASLTAQQRTILGPLERDWGSVDSPRRAKWIEVANRFPAMPAADQQRVQERMAEWARMTPAERGRARLTFQETKQLSPEQKQAHWEAYQALPDEQRKALALRGKPADERPRAASGPAATAPLVPAPKAAPAAMAPRQGASTPPAKPVTPTVVQAKPGATTTLMTTPVAPPAHHRPGQPKIAAQPGQVDPSTLLPQSGPQAAAAPPATRQP